MCSRVLSALPALLSPRGLAYLVLEHCNRPAAFMERADRPPLACQLVLSRRAGREHLHVVRISRR
jgi:release factor glutamine methyltransferase